MLITSLQCLNPLIHGPKAQNSELNIQVLQTRGLILCLTHQNPHKYVQLPFVWLPKPCSQLLLACALHVARIYCLSAMEMNLESIIHPSVATQRDVQLWEPLHLLISHIPCFLLQIAQIDHGHASCMHHITSLLVSELMTFRIYCSSVIK